MSGDRPFAFSILAQPAGIPESGRVLRRRLSDLNGWFSDEQAYGALAASGDPLVYEVHAVWRPEVSGELLCGLSVVHPGLVGEEYFMTMGHYHNVRQTAETYLCLGGHGALLMENEEGDWALEELRPGRALYVSPGWAHRSINLCLAEPFVTYFVYPGHAGHDYAAIQATGFRKLVVRRESRAQLIDNPRWSPQAAEVLK